VCPLAPLQHLIGSHQKQKKWFHPKGNEVSALDAVNNQIELLSKASGSPNGFLM